MNRQDLLGDHRQNFQVDSIEFVEARPSAARGQPFEEFTQREVIQTLGTVEHHALLGDSLREVLSRFRFAGSGGTLRCPAQVKVQGTEQRSIASICQRGDHQSRRIAEIFVAVT